MAFESLTEKLQNVFKGLRSKGMLTESDVKASMKEVKMALLEADVNFKVVKSFVKSIEEKAVGGVAAIDVGIGVAVGADLGKDLAEQLGIATAGLADSAADNTALLTLLIRLKRTVYKRNAMSFEPLNIAPELQLGIVGGGGQHHVVG